MKLGYTHTGRQRQWPMLVYGDAWKSIPDPFPSVTMYSNGSSNASVAADAWCELPFKPVVK